ncbi:hypothetical protein AV654_19350 [Paenibacillus elgii]|uniref:Uncharacterized protein n=1 Tax=Paenibacillus elgii TaxID=189691 RepID=A0A163XMM3_9BACL|nr:hypothetical protein [Paenibacillus elgii]KZE78133.1 hypothetical protein AV654_19350 [Paenibacillus elgii]
METSLAHSLMWEDKVGGKYEVHKIGTHYERFVVVKPQGNEDEVRVDLYSDLGARVKGKRRIRSVFIDRKGRYIKVEGHRIYISLGPLEESE